MNIKREPVAVAGGIVGLIMALLMWLRTMGYLDWTPEQASATEQLVAIAVPLILSAIAVVWARWRVTPLVDAKDEDGEPLTRSDNSPALAEQRKNLKG